MKGVPCHLPGKGKGAFLQRPAEVVVVSASSLPNSKSKVSVGSTEPTSVLDTRSPSPPTSSTSTLSSSFGDTAGMVVASDNPPYKWLPSQHISPAPEDEGGGGSWKEERDNHLLQQPILASSLEIGAGGCEKRGLGMEEWESVLPESASSPSNDQSFFQWFGSDMDDPSLKQLLQSGGGAPEFESTGDAGLGIPDMGFVFENVSSNSLAKASANSFGAPATDFACLNGNMMNTCKQQLLSIQNPTNSFSGGGGSFNNDCHPPNPIFSLPPSILDPLDEKPHVFNLQHHIHPQNPAFLLPTPPYARAQAQQQQHHLLPPQPKRRHPTTPDMGFLIPRAPFSDSGQELFLRRQQQQSFSNIHLLPQHLQHKPPLKLMGGSPEDSTTLQQQQQALVDQLLKAAELVEAGNSIHAQEILARLNHQLSPVGKPLHRAAFYFKEALQLLLENNNSTTPRSIPISPLDLVFKITAYKAFSEVSPFLQFVNFTSNQVLLEALHGFDAIHIVDFDIGLGLGGQWASFMQELALRPGGAPSLKITGFASLSSQDPLGLCLAKENLSHFANELAIPLEFNLFNIDSFDLSSIAALPVLNWSENEAVAVNLPVGLSTPSLLRLIAKQLSPKIVLTVDCGCDRSELPFSHYFFNALQSYSLLLDSLDASNASFDAVQKIERFILQPKIESTVLGRHRTGGKLPPWRSLFTSAGFSPVPLSNFTETQADYLLKRLQLRGFHVEKHQASLCLGWQRGELVSVSSWRC